MPRFVLLHHDWPHPHYDLMLERDGVLRTWRLPTLPPCEVERIADHRLHYLDYEGPIHGGRGTVTRIDRGEFTWLEIGDTTSADMYGTIINGIVIIANSHAIVQSRV